MKERLGDKFQPAEINKPVQRRVHLLQVVVVFRTDVDAQGQRLRRGRRGNLGHWLRRVLTIRMHGPPRFPIARLKRAWRGAVCGEKGSSEVTVLNANEILSTLPNAQAPLIEPFQLLVGEIRDLAALAVVRRDRFHRRRIGHC